MEPLLNKSRNDLEGREGGIELRMNRWVVLVEAPDSTTVSSEGEGTGEYQLLSPESSKSGGSNKSLPFCRICHEGDLSSCQSPSSLASGGSTSSGSTASRREKLIQPCLCTGSVAMVHLSCLEHWLTSSNSDKCELCHFPYKTRKVPRSWTEFLTERENQFNVRNMIADLVCFFLLTPLLVVSTYLCGIGAHQYYMMERWEAVGLVILSVFLMMVYFTWCQVTLKYHIGVWRLWVRTHQRVTILTEKDDLAQLTPPGELNNNRQV